MNPFRPSARFFALTLFVLFTLVRAAGRAEPLWTCGMHPQIIKHAPGNCPICGMKLTPVRGDAAGAVAGHNDAIHIDGATVQRMNLKTGLVTRGPVRREIRAVGAVAYDEEGIRDITTKYEGWIEKLFVNTTWTTIKAGDPLFEIYSPDLYNAELNYLVARGSEGETNGPLSRAALGRLQLFDVPRDFISELAESGQARRTFTYRAPVGGVVIEKSAVAGQMMKPGERIYRLADLSTVWVLAQVFEQDITFLQPGQDATVRVTYGPERTITGKVSLLLPQVDEQTRAATARIVLANPDGALRPGMFVDVRFAAQIAADAILVPEAAILRSGDRNTVFVAQEGGVFAPREVKLGARSAEGAYQVLSGLAEGERVVTSGQFMLDSESQLREAIEKLSSGGSAGVPPADGTETTVAAATSSSAGNGAEAPRPPVSPTPGLIALANATADAAATLAQDDLGAYNQQRELVNHALNAWLAGRAGTPLPAEARTAARALPQASDLKSAREAFEPFSAVVTDLARAAHLAPTAHLHAFECPMPPSGRGKARWLQRAPDVRNPFYGSAMPTCGEELN